MRQREKYTVGDRVVWGEATAARVAHQAGTNAIDCQGIPFRAVREGGTWGKLVLEAVPHVALRSELDRLRVIRDLFNDYDVKMAVGSLVRRFYPNLGWADWYVLDSAWLIWVMADLSDDVLDDLFWAIVKPRR